MGQNEGMLKSPKDRIANKACTSWPLHFYSSNINMTPYLVHSDIKFYNIHQASCSCSSHWEWLLPMHVSVPGVPSSWCSPRRWVIWHWIHMELPTQHRRIWPLGRWFRMAVSQDGWGDMVLDASSCDEELNKIIQILQWKIFCFTACLRGYSSFYCLTW